MYKYPNLDKLLLRRTFLLGVGKGILLTGVLGRLIYLQIVKSKQYKLLANKNRISLRLLNPIRGTISDRNGKLLAINQNTFRVLCVVDNKIELNTVKKMGQYLFVHRQPLLYHHPQTSLRLYIPHHMDHQNHHLLAYVLTNLQADHLPEQVAMAYLRQNRMKKGIQPRVIQKYKS